MSVTRPTQVISRVIFVCALMTVLSTNFAVAQDLIQRAKNFNRDVRQKLGLHRSRPQTGYDDAIERLAAEIDWLENYLDEYGSVVAKQPDIWGESRLTKHRREIESELAAKVKSFSLRDNAQVRRSDIADLATALSIGAGVGAPQVSIGSAGGVSVTPSSPEAAEGEKKPAGTKQTFPASTASVAIDGSTSLTPMGSFGASNLEPVIELDQLNRYLNHLAQIRRINEGDDTSDAPGYALNLVRIPVSILPGRATRRGYGAEVTVSANPYKSETLLPHTFRNLVVNDLVDQFGLPIVRVAESPTSEFNLFFLAPENSQIFENLKEKIENLGDSPDKKQLLDLLNAGYGKTPEEKTTSIVEFAERLIDLLDRIGNSEVSTLVKDVVVQLTSLAGEGVEQGTLVANDAIASKVRFAESGSKWTLQKLVLAEAMKEASVNVVELAAKITQIQTQFIFVSNEVGGTSAAFASSLKTASGRIPVPPSTWAKTIGEDFIYEISLELRKSYFGRYVVWNESSDYQNQIHLLDAQKFLNVSFSSAYDALCTEQGRQILFDVIDQGRLAELVKVGAIAQIQKLRQSFMKQLKFQSMDDQVARFCWCIAVEMAVLNQRLNEDVHETAITKGNGCCHPSKVHSYYLPMLINRRDHESGYQEDALDFALREASEQFCEYVNCRWPIHVFAIDPVNQEQNVSDASVVRRELAIATALSFAAGRISLNQLNRFQREFQEDIATVALNRTQVGFAHSNDTFGWRFSPRVQTRAPQGTARAFGETVFGRRADAQIREAVLEPGMRECTAIVLMPSFVPYCDFDVRTNWFRLDKPTHSDVSMKETMRLSRSVTAMRHSRDQCIACESAYRDGEVGRLLRRVEQLEREIPLQSMRAQIPYENTLGGFELFNNGLTDLSPELIGWYGAPGIKIKAKSTTPAATPSSASAPASTTPTQSFTTNIYVNNPPASPPTVNNPATPSSPAGTTLFLVGDNFSVHETQLIAGGQLITPTTLISRQVIQATIPDSVNTVTINGKTFVAIYAATPYGVTGHMHIPIIQDPAKKSQASLSALEKRVADLEVAQVTWAQRPELETSIKFGVNGSCCDAACIRPLNPNLDFELAPSAISRAILNDSKRELMIYGVLRRTSDQTVLGQPFQVVEHKFDFEQGNKPFKAGELFANGAIRDRIASHVRSTEFAKENSVSLTLETFVTYLDENSQFGQPIRIEGSIPLKLVLTDCESLGGDDAASSANGVLEMIQQRSVTSPEPTRSNLESGPVIAPINHHFSSR